jgi:hypothetical protein
MKENNGTPEDELHRRALLRAVREPLARVAEEAVEQGMDRKEFLRHAGEMYDMVANPESDEEEEESDEADESNGE